MEWLTDTLARAFGPLMRPVSRWLLSERRAYHTWVYEFVFVGALLLAVTFFTTDWASARGIVGAWAAAFGVFFSFGHAKVASRMMEAQAATPRPAVPCYHMSDRYWVVKEIAWFVAFVATGIYPALVGNLIFLLYPSWRKVHLETRFEVRGTRFAPDHLKVLAGEGK